MDKQREEFEAWAVTKLGDNPTWRESGDCELAWQAWQAAQAAQPAQPEGWKLVPVEPTEAMWSELARDIVFWMQVTPAPHYGSKLHEFLRNCGTTIPDWFTNEIPDVDHTPPKATVAVCIYKAMLAAAPSTKDSK